MPRLFSTTIARPLQLLTRCLQWTSAVVVLGLSAFFISRGPRGQHIIYQLVIAVLSAVFFMPAFISPFLPTRLSKFVLAIDVVFSYLWLTAFIFAAQDYNQHQCFFHAPPGLGCNRKKANEAFIFLAFIFTLGAALLEVASLWAYRKENPPSQGHEKNSPGGRQPLDAPADSQAPAGTV